MNEAAAQLKKLENEVFGLAHLDDKLRRYRQRGCSVHEEVTIVREMRRIDERIRKAIAEIKDIDAGYIRRVPELKTLSSWFPAQRKSVRFFGIAEV